VVEAVAGAGAVEQEQQAVEWSDWPDGAAERAMRGGCTWRVWQ
jgi:hypothetical protein